jgi:GNAT superfamily N-acetyltransferase
MTDNNLIFCDYNNAYFEKCIKIFDLNCPKYFAINERQDYIEFLQNSPESYKVGFINEEAVAVFGLDIAPETNHARITWIITSPSVQAKGIGTDMMSLAKKMAKNINIEVIDIAASHLSAPFFAKFGAKKVAEIKNGWGLDMHRVDMELPL